VREIGFVLAFSVSSYLVCSPTSLDRSEYLDIKDPRNECFVGRRRVGLETYCSKKSVVMEPRRMTQLGPFIF
jgi:hypothetical protein